MHKDDLVARMEFTNAGYFSAFEGFYNRELMPPGTRVQDAMVTQRFKSWLETRCISKDRENYIKVLSSAGVNTKEQFYLRNYGLSLNDCYWFKAFDAINSDFGWNDVNFFKNSYSDFVGNILVDNSYSSYVSDFLSPELTTFGNSRKMWYQNKNTLDSYMLKFGTKENNYQEPYIEVIVSIIAQKLGIPNIECKLINKTMTNGQKKTACISKNFCTEDVEFIPAQLLMVEPGLVGKNGMINYAKRHNLKQDLDKMIVLDYITCNSKRDMSNFGFLRDANTFKSIGLAPIFSNGNSLWIDWKKYGIGKSDDSKPFESTHEKQIELVDDFSWINFSSLDTIEFDVKQVLRHSEFPYEIQEKICKELRNRINKLEKIAINKKQAIVPQDSIIEQKIENTNKIELSKPDSGFGS